MQTGVAKGLKVPCLFMINEVSIRCQKNPGGWYTPYTRVYPPPNTPVDISCLPCPQQQTRRTLLQRSIDETDRETDRHRTVK